LTEVDFAEVEFLQRFDEAVERRAAIRQISRARVSGLHRITLPVQRLPQTLFRPDQNL
jgi:hypothetical protein